MIKNKLFLTLWIVCPLLFFSFNVIGNNGHLTVNEIPISDVTFTISATPNNVTCGGVYGSIDVVINGGIPPYSVEWDNNDSSIWAETTTSKDNYNISDLPKGTYLVKVKDATGHGDMVLNIKIEQDVNDFEYTLTPNDPCQEYGSMTINVTGSSPPYWVILDGPSSGGMIANDNNFRIDNLLKGNYTVKVEKDGCGQTQTTTLITSTKKLSGNVRSVEDNNSCSGYGAASVFISGGTSEYFISWYGPSSGSTRTTAISKLIQNLVPGDYTFEIKDANNCSIIRTVTVTAKGDPMSATLTQKPANCTNLGQIDLTISSGVSGYSVAYSGPKSGTVAVNSSGVISIPHLPSGDYSITIKDGMGCTITKSITVGSEMSQMSTIVTQTPVECDNMGQLGIAISGGDPTYRIDYTGPKSGSLVATTTGGNSGTGTILDLPAGLYTILVTDSRGCSDTESITVTGSVSDISTIVTQTPVECDNMGQIGVSISGGDPTYRIDYTGPKSGSMIATTTGARAGNGTILGMPAGTYTIVVTDSRGCSDTESITVTGSISDMSTVVTQTPVLCDNMGQVGVAITGGEPSYRIDYSGPRTGSVIATTTSVNSGTGAILDLPLGNYAIVVTDSRGCSDTKSITVNNSVSDLACVLNQTPQICDNMGGITIGISGGYPAYRVDYTGPTTGAVIATTTGSRAGTANISGLSAGTYTITVSDSKGCTASESITVGGGASDMVCTVGVQSEVCTNNSGLDIGVRGGTPVYTISYTGPVSGTYVSTNGATQFVPLPLGTYTVVVTDANGCSETVTATVGTGVNDLHCRLEKTYPICHKLGTIEVIISGGKPGFTVKWSAGHSENVATVAGYNYKFEVPCPGIYNITVIDANGCEVMESTEIFQLENNLAYQVFPNPGVQEGNGSLAVYFQNGQAPYTINLTGPSVQTQITNGPIVLSSLPSGVYSVNITDANGCDKQTYVTVPTVGGNPPQPTPDGMKVAANTAPSLTAEKTTASNNEVVEKLTSSSFDLDDDLKQSEFMVYQNYPNPFKLSTTIGFNLPEDMKVKLIVHDYLGKQVSVMERDFSKGYNEYEFNQQNLVKGVYYYTISAGKEAVTNRMLRID